MVLRSLRDEESRQFILDRLAALTPEHPRLWGRMDPAQLLPHLAGGLRSHLDHHLRQFGVRKPA